MDRRYSLKHASKGLHQKDAAETSLERVRQSIEDALEKEREYVEKEAVNQYIRDASLRMSLNLSIKPRKNCLKDDKANYSRNDYKLPSLQQRDVSPSRRPDLFMVNAENTARPNTSKTNKSVDTSFSSSPNNPNIRLPPIIIDTGQQEKVGKRKRKRKKVESSDIREKKERSPERLTSKPPKTRLENVSPFEEDFNVVMCGRSPKFDAESKELFVSKHGRFKSK